MKPLVSILIPAYNAQEWIADTVQSALAQTWDRKEIIVVDDGSTDGTLQAIRPFEAEGVKIVSQKNQGAAAARNTAFAHSTGEYIQWLDADDLLAPDKIARQMEMLHQCPSKRTLLSSAWGRFFYRSHRTRFVPTALWCDLSPAEWLVRKMGQNLFMQPATWLVHRELTEAAGPWDTRLIVDDDGEYFCRLLLSSDGTRFVPESKVYYRISGFSSVSYIGRSNRKIETQWISMQLQIQYLRSLEDSPRARAACVQYLQDWLPSFYPERMDIVRQAEQMAAEMGGRLEVQTLSWKYAWIQAVFGWKLAKRARLFFPGLRLSLRRSWDKVLYRHEHRGRLAYRDC